MQITEDYSSVVTCGDGAYVTYTTLRTTVDKVDKDILKKYFYAMGQTDNNFFSLVQ